jgi:hypothetical protein
VEAARPEEVVGVVMVEGKFAFWLFGCLFAFKLGEIIGRGIFNKPVFTKKKKKFQRKFTLTFF